MIEQLSIYTENKKGTMHKLLSVLSDASINVLGFVNMDSAEFGTVRLLLSDTKKAEDLLTCEGYLVRKGRVIGIELPDEPGALDTLLGLVGDMNVNVNYMYLGYNRETSMPITILNTENLDIVFEMLKRNGYTVY